MNSEDERVRQEKYKIPLDLAAENFPFHPSALKIDAALKYAGIDITNRQFPKVFVETGASVGHSIDWAMLKGDFEHIYSCEIHGPNMARLQEKYSSFYYKICQQRFMPNLKVFEIAFADSRLALPKIMSQVSSPALIWLDAHPGSGVPVETGIPLYEELKSIQKHPVKNHLIIIDDAYCFENPSLDSGIYEDIKHSEIEDMLRTINPDYVIINTVRDEVHGPCSDMIMAIPPYLTND